MTLEELQESLTVSIDRKAYSPYAMTRVVNSTFGIDLPPQMMYNYVQKGYITAVKNELGKLTIDKDEVRRFIVDYGTRRGFVVVNETE